MSGKKLLFKYLNSDNVWKETVSMDIASYFELVKYVMMAATLVVLVLIFLYVMYGKDEKES
jgi:hypothetical protein